MRTVIFLSIGLFFLGTLSIGNCRLDNSEESGEQRRSYTNNVRSRSWNELFKSLPKARSYGWDASLESEEDKRDAMTGKRTCTGGCTPACHADQMCIAPNQCVCPNGYATSPCPIQSAPLCAPANVINVKPIVSITFGSGSAKYSTTPIASLGFQTTYKQVNAPKISDGSFAIMNEVPADFVTWLGGGLDHTQMCKAGGEKGYMMVVNADLTKKEVLNVKADKLCVGLRYQFSMYVANLIRSGSNIIKPSLQMTVKTATGGNLILADLLTDGIREQGTLTWVEYGMSFVATTTSVVLSITSTNNGGGGNDFALDDITLVSCSPESPGTCA